MLFVSPTKFKCPNYFQYSWSLTSMAHLLLTWHTLFQKWALLLRKTAGPWRLKSVGDLMSAFKCFYGQNCLSLTFALSSTYYRSDWKLHQLQLWGYGQSCLYSQTSTGQRPQVQSSVHSNPWIWADSCHNWERWICMFELAFLIHLNISFRTFLLVFFYNYWLLIWNWYWIVLHLVYNNNLYVCRLNF